MLAFQNDYSEGTHPSVLAKLVETNLEQLPGYGTDHYCETAKEKIRKACGAENADIYFLSGGTQTNRIVIAAMLQPYEGVISAVTGHVNGHEAGAIEASGHRVLALPQVEGKIKAADLRQYLVDFYADENHEHMVFPGMVYVTHATECGTLYTKTELKEISDICKEYELPLFLDGARLGYGLMSDGSDLTLEDIAELCDVFYIGGTKVGALCGEAVIFPKATAPKHFMTTVKQNGGLLAKGGLMGVQFDALFTDDLYFDISRHAILMAKKLKAGLEEKGYRFFMDSPTNQQFLIMENKQLESLKEQVIYGFWEKYDETNTVIRLATSWATQEDDVDALLEIL